jgi:tetratricopeptide (TPR) repeat protein
MLEARELRKKHNLPEGSFLAGATQGMSGQRVVEAEIKAREALDETKPEYWMERAAYYNGRKEAKEEEEALRRALALYDVAELRRDGGAYDYRHVFSSLFHFLWRLERHDEAVELFKAHRVMARHNASVLWAMYYDCEGYVLQAGRHHELEAGLMEDLRDAYQRLKEAPKEDNPEYSEYWRNSYSCVSLLDRPSLTISTGILDFKNDSVAWDILMRMTVNTSFPRHINLLLFPKGDKGQVPDEKILQKLKDLANRKTLGVMRLQEVGGVLAKATDYENSNWFYLASVKQTESEHDKAKSYTALSANYRAMGDWQNSEDYIYMAAKLGELRVDALQQTADLAEKSGATDAARRMRERIRSLGGK